MRSGNYKETYSQLLAMTDSRLVMFATLVLIMALIAFPFMVNTYVLSFGVMICIMAIGVLGLNMLTGNAGLISLGFSGFLAVGAYTNAILVSDYGWPTLGAIICSGLMAAAVSLLVGIPSLRLKGLYLAITTLAFSVIINQVILEMEWLTHGSAGILVSRAAIFGYTFKSEISLYYLMLGFASLFTLATINIMRSRIGRAFNAIRQHDIAAKAMGVDLVRYKLLAFMLSSFYIGVAGALFSYRVRFINVDNFDFLLSIESISMIIVGGLGTIAGSLLGTAFMVALPEIARIMFDVLGGTLKNLLSTNALEIKGVIYGLVIVVFLRYEPDGIVGKWRDIKRYWLNWPLSH
jgi:branched-chain amino acid transport system permease protein|tara:strand:+ start:1093 stop:2139 length:1047 start_codon:yes stop_codon:yes gene_type:complete